MDVTALPTIRQLQYLVTLDETRHFRKAAEALHITQPSLSVQLKTLEETLGVTLAERGRGGVVLTPVGRDVAEMARRVLSDVRAITDYTTSAPHGLSGTLKLGAPPTLGPYLLPHVVRRLHREHPDLRLHVREEPPSVLQSALLNGSYDLILTPTPVSSSDLEVDHLFREPLYLVCANDHPLARRGTITPKDLKGAQVLALEPQHHLHSQILELCKTFHATPLKDFEGTSLDTLRLMVGTGLGISFLPALYVTSEIGARGEVSVGTVKGKGMSRTIGLAWRKNQSHLEGYKLFAEAVRSVVRAQFKDVSIL